MTRRKLPNDRNVKRKAANKKPKSLILAVCEGANTEPAYLSDFAKHHGNNLVSVQCIKGAGAPVTIVDKAVNEKKTLARNARKSGNSFDSSYQVWAVFDIDEHPNISQAVDKAHANGVMVARSNPCFEIWPLLHINNQGAHIHRHDLQRKLRDKMPSYDPSSSKKIDYDSIKNNYETAKKRAESLMMGHEEVGSPLDNPSTDIFELLEEIKRYGKG